MKGVVYIKLSFEKNFQRVDINEPLFEHDQISVQNLESYLESNFYKTPVEVVQQSVNQQQFVHNYSSVVLTLHERLIEKGIRVTLENRDYDLTVRLPKNKTTIKIKYLINLIKIQLHIDDRIFISTSKQPIFSLEDSISIFEHIFISNKKPSSPTKTFFNQYSLQQENIHIQEDELSAASTTDSSDEINLRDMSDEFTDSSPQQQQQQQSIHERRFTYVKPQQNTFILKNNNPFIKNYHHFAQNQTLLQNKQNLFISSLNKKDSHFADESNQLNQKRVPINKLIRK